MPLLKIIHDGDVVRPKPVRIFECVLQSVQDLDDLCRTTLAAWISRVREYAHHSVFRERTGGPARPLMLQEPFLHRAVSDMIRIHQRNQGVDVQQRSHAARPQIPGDP